jgi:hypothetical protein
MTGEEIFNLLNTMAARGDSPRKRERNLKKLADKTGLSSDALRAKARRYARKTGASYPLMRKPATINREAERQRQREERQSWKSERIAQGKEALAAGADWAELARLFEIKTPEGAAQWWRRNVEGLAPAKSTRKRRRRLIRKAA